MKNLKQKYICAAFSAFLFSATFLFLWLYCPQYLTYQEQYQLFLFSSDYFLNTIREPGGVADYISEFIMQFCYIPLYGAALISLLLTMQQILLGIALTNRQSSPLPLYCLCALPAILMLGAFGDENTLLSFATALTITSAAFFLSTFICKDLVATIVATLAFIPLYWFVGGVALLYPLCVTLCHRRYLLGLASLIVCVGIVFAVHHIWCVQYPLGELFLGLNYYRIPFMHPAIHILVSGIVALLAALSSFKPRLSTAIGATVMGAVVIFAAIYVPSCFNKEKSSIFEYDMLVRQGRWTDIISKAEKERPADNFRLQALNLALAKTNQLCERMFEFDQRGIESLINPPQLDNTTTLITSEVLFQLPFTNAALSTTFDLQESIMNNRKSGRFMKRMAECMIINGRYDVARKYIDILSRSLFYSDWADETRKLLGNDEAVANHPVYGPKRRMAFSQKEFYFMPEINKILTMLAIDSKGENTLAWQYCNAANMLMGDLPTLAAMNANRAMSGYASTPKHVQEALAMFWTMSHTDFNDVPFEISPQIRSAIASLSATMMRNPNNQAAWKSLAKSTYWAYFLERQQQMQNNNPVPQAAATHE